VTQKIENAKVMKREQKIVSRFKSHAERTAQSFEDERATRLSKFMLLGEEVAETERFYDRAEEIAVRSVIDEIVSIRGLLKEEKDIQEKVRIMHSVCLSVSLCMCVCGVFVCVFCLLFFPYFFYLSSFSYH
jgi:hypothetical protein